MKYGGEESKHVYIKIIRSCGYLYIEIPHEKFVAQMGVLKLITPSNRKCSPGNVATNL